MGWAESDWSGMEGFESRERPFWAAHVAGQDNLIDFYKNSQL